MTISQSITSDVDTALEVLTRDASAVWLNTAATMLEDCARRIREEVKANVEKEAR